MLVAVKVGDYDAVKDFLISGIDPNAHFPDEPHNAVLAAFQTNNHPIIQLLLSNGADPDFGLVRHKELRTIYDLTKPLATNYTEDQELPEIIPLLQLAMTGSNVEAINCLIRAGADVDSQGFDEETALHLACQQGWPDFVSHLLQNGANKNARNSRGQTPLHVVSPTHHNLIIELLLEAGANVGASDEDGNCPIHNFSREIGDNSAIVEKLLLRGASADVQDNTGMSALHIAILIGNLDVARTLVDSRADIHLADHRGNAALHFACQTGSLNLIRLIVNAGADVEARATNGFTPLHYAVKQGEWLIVEWLLRKGVDVESRDKFAQTVLIHAVKKEGKNFVKTAEILLNHGANVNTQTQIALFPLMIAANRGRLDVCKLLLRYGADITKTDADGRDALTTALTKGHWDVVDLLERHMPGLVLFASCGAFELVRQIDSEEGTLAFECR